MWCARIMVGACLLHAALAVKVKVVMHSEQEDSKLEEDDSPRTDSWDHKKRQGTILPFIKRQKHVAERIVEYDDDKTTTEKAHQIYPNDIIFPLIYRQSHINSMFKFGDNWYTWATEKRTDGSKAINYYICYDEPKRCDDVGWEHTDTPPKCAFQIDSLMFDDRACINSFGIEPHAGSTCDGGEQMKVSDIVRSCGPRIRSLWRFVRAGRRPPAAAKPADVNSLLCEDEEECFISVEYRIHHDRITFSLHDPTRGQTYKSVLKREAAAEEEKPAFTTEPHLRLHRNKKIRNEEEPLHIAPRKKMHLRPKPKQPAEGKGILKERNDSEYTNRRAVKNKIKIRDDNISDDNISE